MTFGLDDARTLIDHVDTMVCSLDLEGRFTSVNLAGERVTGYSAGELLGRYALELIAPEARDEAVARFRRRLTTKGELPPDESVLLTRDGERIPIEVRSVLVAGDQGESGVLALVRDLREAKRGEAALSESQERFRNAFAYAAIGMAVVDLDGRYLQVNDSLCEIVGYSADELREMTFRDLTHPDDLAASGEPMARLLAGEIRSYQIEKRYVHKSGRVVWIVLNVSLVRRSDGTPIHFISQIHDVTEQRAIEESVRKREAQLAEAQRLARLGSWEWDIETDRISWSAELCRIFEVDPGVEISYEQYLGRLYPDDRPRMQELVRTALETGEAYEIEHRIVLPDGSLRWLHGRGQGETEDGRVVRLRGTAQEITERKQAEEKLLEAERRYRTLVEQLPLAIYVRPLRMDDSNVYVSPQVEPMLGYPAEEWLTNPRLLETIIHPDDRERLLADGERVRRTGEPLRAEYRYVTPDGRIVWVYDETYLVADESGEPQYVQGYLLDITERKRAEEERDRLREALHHSLKLEALGRLAGGVAHDFNNMLTAIKGYSELLLDTLPAGSPGYAEASQIRRAADHASALPRQLLAFGRKQDLQPRVLEVDAALVEAGELLRRLAGDLVEVTIEPGAGSARVVADPGQLEQALLNLVLNAKDAMPEGGRVAITSSTASVPEELADEHGAQEGIYAVLSVVDTGHGMDADVVNRAFEPFFTTKSHGEGSGLGLSMVYGFVAQSGGFVNLESSPGEGTRLEIWLPLTDLGVPSEPVPEPTPEPAGRRAAIVLVEDEDVVRDLAKAALERAGHRVVTAASGAEAIEHCERHGCEFDVLVSDMVMPGMGGKELASEILRRRPGTGVVLMSGYTNDGTAFAEVDHAFLEKPFSPADLVAAVTGVLERLPSVENGGPQVTDVPVDVTPAAVAPDTLTCLVADDHPAVLDSVSRYLGLQGIQVVASVSRGDDALALISELEPAVALLDVSMEPISGIQVARDARDASPGTRFVLYTGHRDNHLLEQALDAGAQGFVLKEAPLTELVRALRAVAQGGTYVDPELSSVLTHAQAAASNSPLTRREREVLALLADGLTNDKVALELGISAETVQTHVGKAMTKLQADTRTEAVATAIRQSIIV